MVQLDADAKAVNTDHHRRTSSGLSEILPAWVMFVFSLWKGRRKDKDTPVPVQDEYKQYLEEDHVKEKITDVDLNKLVPLPTGLDYQEWLASNTISFFEHINLMYGTVSEFCTVEGCCTMMGPGNTQYLWFDEKGKKCKCAAPQYVDYVMTFTQKTIHDESVFPTKYANVFPSSFEEIVKKIHRLLLHVLAHIYHSHFKEIVLLTLHGHLNSLCQHFLTFVRQFKLVEEKETEVLEDLYQKLLGINLDKNDNMSSDNKENEETNENVPKEPKEGTSCT